MSGEDNAVRLGRALREHVNTLVLALLIPGVFIATCIAIPGFFSSASLKSLLLLSSILGIASMGQTVVILLGAVDLSIPGVIAMASVLEAVLGARHWSFWAIGAVIAAIAVVAGAINGAVSALLRAPSLVVTLAMGTILVGGTQWASRGSSGGEIPSWITTAVSVGSDSWFIPLPPVVVLWLVLGAFLILGQRRAHFFRRVYAAGSSPDAARLSLVRVPLLWTSAFAVSALFAAVAGILLGGFSGGATTSVGDPYLFLTIAAVVVGGTSLLGGRGGYGLTMAGCFLITNLTTLLLGVGISNNLQQSTLGALIVALVFMYGREAPVSARV